jgi:hypothetical protein
MFIERHAAEAGGPANSPLTSADHGQHNWAVQPEGLQSWASGTRESGVVSLAGGGPIGSCLG